MIIINFSITNKYPFWFREFFSTFCSRVMMRQIEEIRIESFQIGARYIKKNNEANEEKNYRSPL